ncbi:MAG: AEC family transporter [Candidatus Omnitrophota bacterium]
MYNLFMASFRTSSLAISEIMLIGLCGFLLAKKGVFKEESIKALSRFLILIVVPFFIFTKLLKNFNFSIFPNWWLFPLLSLVINLLGFILGFILIKLNKGIKKPQDFISLVTFQNSGYLVLALAGALFQGKEFDQILIYIFLFLLGFNLLIWSFGVWFLVKKDKNHLFEYELLFSPTVIAIVVALITIYFKLEKFVPSFVFKPMSAIGDTTIVLAMLVVGANLGAMKNEGRILDKKAIFYVCLLKLIIMPLIALLVVSKLNLSSLLSLFIVMECAVPSATTLSVIAHGYEKDTHSIDQGIFWTHLASIITLPIFLAFTL